MQLQRISANSWRILRGAIYAFVADNALSRAAAMSFYATTSLAPILLIVIAIAGLAVGRDAAQLAVSAQMSGLLGSTSAELLKSVVDGAAKETSGILAGIFAIVTLIVTASGVFGEMQSSLNQIWKVPPSNANLSTLVRARVASLGLVASLGFLLLVSLAASTAISAFSDLINRHLPAGTMLVAAVNTIISVSLIAILFAAIYKVLPDRALTWRDVGFGAVVTAILFTMGKSLIGWYLGTSAVASSYGAAGSLILLLLWVFYSSAIFLLGAEITHAYAKRFGIHSEVLALAQSDGIDDFAGASPHQQSATENGAVAIAAISFVAAATATIAPALIRRRRRTAPH